jgi:hypothetical protein
VEVNDVTRQCFPAWVGQDVDHDGTPDMPVSFCGRSPRIPLDGTTSPVVVQLRWQEASPGLPVSIAGDAVFRFTAP